MDDRLTAEQIYHGAREKSDSAARADYLERACGTNVALRARVEALLKADAEAGSFLRNTAERAGYLDGDATLHTSDAARPALRAVPPAESRGETIGRYKLLQSIGEGGFGSVWMAEQEQPVRRRVALKIIKLGMDTKQVIARFEAERQALAMMDHAYIARVYDAGATSSGRPYFVMELVRGVPINEYCDAHTLTLRQRLELFIQVCEAIQHAHHKGLIHRDINPSNVLVATQDDRPVPKVIDFGIAKATNLDLTDKTLFTAHAQVIGTPAYMSPEQASNSPDIDTRSDIYSLGVLLYELMSGITPFDATRLRSAGLAGIQRILTEEEPRKPSTRLSELARVAAAGGGRRKSRGSGGGGVAKPDTPATPVTPHLDRTRPAGASASFSVAEIAQRRQMDPAALPRVLRGDLDWIVMKCLEKDRRRRYESAGGLAADIERHLMHQPVSAGAPGAAYRVRKFVWRNRATVLAALLVTAALVVGMVGTSIGFVRATRARADADRNAAQARAAEAVALEEKALAQRQAYSANMLGASDALERGQVDIARGYLDSAPPQLRGWEWRHLSSRLDLSRLDHNHNHRFVQLHVAPDGRSYYGVSHDQARTIQRFDIENGRWLQTIPVDGLCWTSWLVAGGTRLVTHIAEAPRMTGLVEVWDTERAVRIASWPIPNVFQPTQDGSVVAYVWQDSIHLMDLRTGAVRISSMGPVGAAKRRGANLCFQPDGRRLAVEWALGQIQLVDTESLEVQNTFEAHDNAVWTLAFSPDGALLASASADGTVRITNVTANPPVALATLRGHAGFVLEVCFSPDGSLLASRGQDRTVRLWDVRTGSARGVFQTVGDQAGPIAFLPDRQTVISADDDGTVHFWDVHSADAWVLRGHRSYVYPVLLSPDGATIYSGGWDGFVGQPGCLRIWDAATGEPVAATGAADAHVVAAALSPDGSRLALSSVAGGDARIEVIDTSTGARVASIPESAFENRAIGIVSLEFDPTGARLAWVNGSGTAILSDAQTGATLTSRRFSEETNGASIRLAWRPNPAGDAWRADRAILAVCDGVAGTLSLVDGLTLEPLRSESLGHRGSICALAFSPDGRRIVTAAEAGIARVWEVATGTLVHELIGHGNRLLCAAYSPDGRRIATAGNDNVVQLWDAHSFDPVARLGGHADYIYSLVWRADSQQLISGSGDHTIRIWETLPLKDRLAARRERQDILAQVAPRVAQWFDELSAAAKVVERVKADATLSPRARQVALQLALRTAIERGPSTAAPPSPRPSATNTASSLPGVADTPPARYACPRAAGEIAIDGRMDEASWARAPWTSDFVDIEGAAKPLPRLRTRAKMLWDDQHLYVGAELEEPHVWSTLTRHDEIVYNDNDFEIFIDPDGDGRCYFEMEINAANTIFDLVLTASYRNGGPVDHDWNAVGLRSAVHVEGTPNDPTDTDRSWSVEFAIPWSALSAACGATPPPGAGAVWRMNFSRVQWRHEVIDGAYRRVAGLKEDNWVWSPQFEIDMHIPQRWGHIEFVGASPR